MKFELTKEMMAGRHLCEKESISTHSGFKPAERAMLNYADGALPQGIRILENGEIFTGGGAAEYQAYQTDGNDWGVGDRTGMSCGDFTLWITRVE